jgi:Ca2+-binding EF-hand superfamily protein
MSSKRLSLGTAFLSSKKKEDLSELFTSFDKDNDGKISRSELSDMLHSAGVDSKAIPSMVNKNL